jgi:hypothetical protein
MSNPKEQLTGALSRFSSREKMWFLSLVGLILLLWSLSFNSRCRFFLQNWEATATQIKGYRYWISNAGTVRSNLDRVLKWVDPQKTLTGTQFSGKAEDLARSTHLTYSMTSPRTREGDIFDAHTLQLRCENANLASLIDFENQIHREKPYMGLEKVKIGASEYNPSQVEADFDLIALQLKTDKIK